MKKPEPIKLFLHPPKNYIPYKNRWGHWVFRLENQIADKNWPGFKNDKGWHPVFKDDKWEWEADDER